MSVSKSQFLQKAFELFISFREKIRTLQDVSSEFKKIHYPINLLNNRVANKWNEQYDIVQSDLDCVNSGGFLK